MTFASDLDLPRPFGPYTLLRRLAVGGMAEVYVAKTKGIGGFEKAVAIKVIHPRYSEDETFVQMLVEEAKISVLLTHVNVAQTFDLQCLEDTYCIVMELVEGADAYRVMRKCTDLRKAMPIDVATYVVSEMCNGLDYAHRKRDPATGKPLGIVHRDISPQNVLISFAGEVKIVDFGIAKAASRSGQTEAGVIKGKYYYMSPEQAWGDPTDHRSDIFSTGIVLYELLTGRMLYQEDNVPLLLDKVRKADVNRPETRRPSIPRPLSDIVMKALAKRPEDRFQSAQEFGHALSQFLYTTTPTFSASRLADLMALLFPEDAQRVSGTTRLPSGESPVENRFRGAEFSPQQATDSRSIPTDRSFDDETRDDAVSRRQRGDDTLRPRSAEARAPVPAPVRSGEATLDLKPPPSGRGSAERSTAQSVWDEETEMQDDENEFEDSTVVDMDTARREPDSSTDVLQRPAGRMFDDESTGKMAREVVAAALGPNRGQAPVAPAAPVPTPVMSTHAQATSREQAVRPAPAPKPRSLPPAKLAIPPRERRAPVPARAAKAPPREPPPKPVIAPPLLPTSEPVLLVNRAEPTSSRGVRTLPAGTAAPLPTAHAPPLPVAPLPVAPVPAGGSPNWGHAPVQPEVPPSFTMPDDAEPVSHRFVIGVVVGGVSLAVVVAVIVALLFR